MTGLKKYILHLGNTYKCKNMILKTAWLIPGGMVWHGDQRIKNGSLSKKHP
jgi:hypothetical protein